MRFADKTTIYIPLKYMGIGKQVEDMCYTITRAVGGVSIDEVRGGYVMQDGTLHYERIARVSWWHTPYLPELIGIAKIARHLLTSGEEAVLVEYQRMYAADTRCTARLWTLADVTESDDE